MFQAAEVTWEQQVEDRVAAVWESAGPIGGAAVDQKDRRLFIALIAEVGTNLVGAAAQS
jgi:hypothetical protein